MDPKSTAKSKRSHTQHARRAHAAPAAIAYKKKKATEATKSTSANRSLPSNCDRYDDIDDGNLGSKDSTDIEIPLPKSKGADFGYLIEQARSQPKDHYGSSSVDDFSFDFMQGVSSILSVRGKSLLSQCADDNFIVDDDYTSRNEIPFLSMDLHALDAQLSRLKLSQRLFIEADLLPDELIGVESDTTSASKELEISEPTKPNNGFDSQALLNSPVSEINAISQTGSTSVFKHGEMNQGTESSKNSENLEQCSRREVQKPILEQKKTTRFEVADAEAELDLLLNSFNQTALSDYSTSRDPDASRNIPATSSHEDSIDDLFSEISFPKNPPLDLRSTNQSVLDSIDESIDDLLAGTSVSLEEQKRLALDQRTKGIVLPSRETMDDFDSWLDTL